MPVERVTIEEMADEAQKVLPMNQPTQTIQRQAKNLEVEYSAILAGFKVTARILAVRFFLFLSLVGSFALSVIATENASPQSAYVLILYALVTTIPLVVLEWRGKGG